MSAIVLWVRSQWDRVLAWSLISVGVALIASAAGQAQDNVRVADQLSVFLSEGVAGVGAALLGCGLLVSAGFHDQWRKLHRVEAVLSTKPGTNVPRDADAPSFEPLVTPGRWLRAEWDRILGVAMVVVGLGIFLVSVPRATDALFAADQVSTIVSGGLGSLLLVAGGISVLAAADVRDIDYKLSRLEAALRNAGLLYHSAHLELRPGEHPLGSAVLRRRVRRGPLLAATVVAASGVSVVVIGWIRAADALDLGAALDGLTLALAGIGCCMIAVLGVGTWVRHELARKSHDLLAPVLDAETLDLTVEPPSPSDTFWTAEGLQRFHQESCPALVMSGARYPVIPGQTGLEPCLLCDAGDAANA